MQQRQANEVIHIIKKNGIAALRRERDGPWRHACNADGQRSKARRGRG